jgi:NAD(P)H-dependent flavin oxidoreductase YrpB (nitropropane dioxygenase family)
MAMGKRVLRTKLCNMLGIEYPILSAGMGPTLAGFIEANKTDFVGGLAGQVSGIIKEIKPAARALEEMVEQAAHILTRKLPESVTVN